MMHIFMNCMIENINSIKGEHGIEENQVQMMLHYKLHPYLKNLNIRPPWVASQYAQHIADSVNRCMQIPTSYSCDYTYDFPIHYIGSMMTHQRLVFTVSYMKYIFSFLDISRSHRMYFKRFSEEMASLISPCILKSSVPQLAQRILETSVLRESLFPMTENQFMFHEIVDVVHTSITNFGVPGSMMCFFGERFIGLMSSILPEGGQNLIDTVFKRLSTMENAYDTTFASYKEAAEHRWTDNSDRYSFKTLKFFGKCNTLNLVHDIKRMLIYDVLEFLNSQQIIELGAKSKFVRIIYAYETMCRDQQGDIINNTLRLIDNENMSIVLWLEDLHTIFSRHPSSFTPDLVAHLVHDVVDLNYDDLSTEARLELNNDNKVTLLLSDFTSIIVDMYRFGTDESLVIPTYTKAWVKGVQLRGRGADCCESELYFEDLTNTNRAGEEIHLIHNKVLNELKNTWYKKLHYNAWCFVDDWYSYGENRVRKKFYVAHLNYFFRLWIPSDGLVHGLPFVNAVLREPEFQALRNTHYITTDDSKHFFNNKQFICANYIKSTAIATSGLYYDVDNYPNLLKPLPMRFPKPVDSVNCYPTLIAENVKPDQLTRLHFIELHPERDSIKYSGIELDLDRTKVFETKDPIFYRKMRKRLASRAKKLKRQTIGKFTL